MITRRNLITCGGAAVAGGALTKTAAAADESPPRGREVSAGGSALGEDRPYAEQKAYPPGEPNKDYTPVVTPNGTTLGWNLVDGVKVFHLIAEEVENEFAPGLKAKCWGYNGRTPGPTIEAVEGDRVRIYVTNRLPEPTTVHWHGILVPNGMDGVAGLNQREIKPGETFKYEFTLRQHGTHMYHPHFDEMTQMGLGMMGMFIIHPRERSGPKIDRDFAIMLSEWRIDPGTSRPNPNEMTDFNVATMNSKVFPATAPLVAKLGDRVRIRFGNLSAMDHHPIHLHGYQFRVVATDGGPVQKEGQQPETTVLVLVGSTRDIEFVANEPGDWAMHCHMTHHVMNQMGHEFPNMIGVDLGLAGRKAQRLLPGYMPMGSTGMAGMTGMALPKNSIAMMPSPGPFSAIDMGGMFTVLKVHPGLTSYDDPGWYQHPPGTVAIPSTSEELHRDGINVAHLKEQKASAVYVCPMHESVRAKKPGKCPKCGMALEPATSGHAGH